MPKKPPPTPEVRRKHRNRRIAVYGTLIVGLVGFWNWQPWEFDIIRRTPPSPNPPVDPDRAKLFAKGTRILLVTAHPDDSEFYIGGTLNQLAKTAAIVQVLCTDGDKGYYPFEDHERNRRVRQGEARAAAKAWNGQEVVFLGYPDGRLRSNEETIARMRKEIERFRPEYILAFDGAYPPRMSHQDHRRAGDLTLEAAKESGIPTWALLFSTIAPNFVVDITDDWERKQELLAIHASQFHGERLVRVTNMVAGTAEVDGERIGVALGEGFRCIKLK
ncbi:MAG: PIG-L deacetylase family protein [Fimbriimonas sp.]